MELQELENNFNKLGHINEKLQKIIRGYETRAQNLTMAYVIFQTLILLSVSLHGSTPNRCQRWWVPFTASLLCSLIFFLAFIDYVSRFYNAQYQLDLNYLEQQIINKQIHETRSSSPPPSSSSSDDIDHNHSIKIKESSSSCGHDHHIHSPYYGILKPDVFQLFIRKVYIIVTLTALIGLAVVVLFACSSFLCGDGSSQGLVTSSPSPSSSP